MQESIETIVKRVESLKKGSYIKDRKELLPKIFESSSLTEFFAIFLIRRYFMDRQNRIIVSKPVNQELLKINRKKLLELDDSMDNVSKKIFNNDDIPAYVVDKIIRFARDTVNPDTIAANSISSHIEDLEEKINKKTLKKKAS